ncbi:MAG: 50S ribosomal protein L30 [Thermoplasmata archaeon]|nr:50S ribosomal protein L30 [Thermoplasmata archaeon]
MSYAVVRVRGTVNVRRDIRETLRMLRLNRVNHCVVIPETPQYRGMLNKVKDYITWGEIDKETLKEMLLKRGRLLGDEPVTEKYILENTPYSTFDDFLEAVLSGEMKLKNIRDFKPVFRLSPPRGGYEDIKRPYRLGGALGYRGAEIKNLIRRML